MSFNIALTGLNAANEDLSVTSNNLANVATVGFKGSRTEFADLFASTQQGAIATGNGVTVSEIAQQFTQGNIQTSGNTLDMAVSGNGFFVLSNKGALNYTRDGEVQLNSTGEVVNSQGLALQAYPPLANGTFNTGGLANISLNTSLSQPQATSTASIIANLPAGATPPADAPLSATDPNSYNNTTSLTPYDYAPPAAAHPAILYFINTAPNTWSVQLTVDGTAVGAPQPLDYSQTGALTTPANGQVSFPAYTPATGAQAMNMTFDFSSTTQYGGNFSVSA